MSCDPNFTNLEIHRNIHTEILAQMGSLGGLSYDKDENIDSLINYANDLVDALTGYKSFLEKHPEERMMTSNELFYDKEVTDE